MYNAGRSQPLLQESQDQLHTGQLLVTGAPGTERVLLAADGPRRLHTKQTGPISMPNSWSVPPTSTGARSTMGRRATFCVLYSKTVLPTLPFRF